MPLISRSPSDQPNASLKELKAERGKGNSNWLSSLGEEAGVALDQNGIILLGGTSLEDFRIRVAQSTARSDMLPSFWSLCGILVEPGVFASVPLDLRPRETEGARARRHNDDVSSIPKCNGIRLCAIAEYDDPRHFPNIAVIRFAEIHPKFQESLARLQSDRSIIDLTSLMLPWLAFVWGTSGATNPLLKGTGLPSAAFVETLFAMAGLELTPGLASASSCPEAMWQGAKWWAKFYEGSRPDVGSYKPAGGSVPMVPQGYYTVRQPAAAIIE
jgi:hypothetical protein